MRELINEFIALGISARAISKFSKISYSVLTNYLSGYRDTLSQENTEKVKKGMKEICKKFKEFEEKNL